VPCHAGPHELPSVPDPKRGLLQAMDAPKCPKGQSLLPHQNLTPPVPSLLASGFWLLASEAARTLRGVSCSSAPLCSTPTPHTHTRPAQPVGQLTAIFVPRQDTKHLFTSCPCAGPACHDLCECCSYRVYVPKIRRRVAKRGSQRLCVSQEAASCCD
jgi:hypothetical protein